ncbi:hypothetical protein GMMP15_80039 [Candidatus Magnetomoraceae bacterium gMMP-15]
MICAIHRPGCVKKFHDTPPYFLILLNKNTISLHAYLDRIFHIYIYHFKYIFN